MTVCEKIAKCECEESWCVQQVVRKYFDKSINANGSGSRDI